MKGFAKITATKASGKPVSMKALAVLLYGMGNMSFCDIARLLGVSAVSVIVWCAKQLGERQSL